MKNARLIRKSLTKRLFIALPILVFLAVNGAAQEYKNLFPASTQIIDVAPYRSAINPAGLKILTVDSDGRVGLTLLSKSANSFLKADYDVLGQALWSSGTINLRERLSADEVPVFETRLTNGPTGTRFHAILTALLSQNPAQEQAGKVYLFAEHDGQVSLALMKQYEGSPGVILDDVNGDGKPELVVESVENTGKAGDIDIWTISSTDAPTKIDLPYDTQYLAGARTYFRRLEQTYHGPGDYTVIAAVSILKMAVPVERNIIYQWNRKTNSYQITRIIDTTATEKVRQIKAISENSTTRAGH